MKNINVQELKQINKYKKQVHKQYPGAYLVTLNTNQYTIMQEQDGLKPLDILATWCIPPATSIIDAWAFAQTSAKINQNLNRTHPLRIEGMNMEDKIARVEARRIRNLEKQTIRNTKEYDIY